MTYQVLARKWRPRSFSTLVGQEHVLRALVNALDSGRVHHAFLFAGTRGVGKTTIARILAKSLNCETGVTSAPCGKCSACLEIDEGRFVDLIEVDAASRTKVDDTRELLDNVQYAPTRGRYKVYLIDEVHMLSGHSFNALLKTLEEPPPHVKFLLATTDPQKLPVTILSRCLQFKLKRLPPDLISGHLAWVLEQEGIQGDAAALKLLAKGADGSMRDALSLLDQAIAYCGGTVSEGGTQEMLGTIDRGGLHALMGAIAGGNAPAAVAALDTLVEQAADPEQILAELADAIQRIALLQVVPDAAGDDDQTLLDLAAQFSPEYAQLCYQLALHGRRDLPLAPEPRGGLEMVVLRMLAFRLEDGASSAVVKPVKPVTTEKARPRPEVASAPDAPSTPATSGDWFSMISSLSLKGMALELARNCVLKGREGDTLVLELDAGFQQLRTANAETRLREALSRKEGRELKLKFIIGNPAVETPAQTMERKASERVQAARSSLAEDPNLKALTDAFGADFNPESVRPVD